MTIRSGHGNGTGVPRIEVLPVDELPAGVPDLAGEASTVVRGAGGRFAPGNALAAAGGRARAGKTRLAAKLGLRRLPDDAAFSPYKRAAVSFRRAKCAELASSVGGGRCGVGPSSIVATAALQLAWSRFLSDVAAEQGDAELALQASRLADASRQNLLAAHELVAKEAAASPRLSPIAALERRLAGARTGQSAFALPAEETGGGDDLHTEGAVLSKDTGEPPK